MIVYIIQINLKAYR